MHKVHENKKKLHQKRHIFYFLMLLVYLCSLSLKSFEYPIWMDHLERNF